ncbi:MAG: beta-N-acetylhexosaminidase [Chloroflexota bacterium]
MHNLIPKPASFNMLTGEFVLSSSIKIIAPNINAEVVEIGNQFVDDIEKQTKLKLEVTDGDQSLGNIQLKLNDDNTLGEEGYELSIQPDTVLINALCPAGLFYGVQTLCQILFTHRTTLGLPAIYIRDTPRFSWRGAMLDVARHFFSVDDVKRYIDLVAHYKMNRLHLHLTDDQGWRIEIKSWPKLTEIGAQTQVNGNGGGFYTQAQYKEIVAYAQSRYVMIIPEIDSPGHTNAALASYPELNVSEEAPKLYEGTEVGFSSLSINMEATYKFLDDVTRELAALTPAPYIHIGGDEARSTAKEDYKIFIKRFQEIVAYHNKIAIGWGEIGEAELQPSTIAQHWVNTSYQDAKSQGAKIILSPANQTYLDMKYDAASPLGLDWAGLISVKDAYDWEPANYMAGLEENDILGIEAPLWTETVLTMKDIEFMAFPRLPGLAELAWSPKGLNWDEYKERLAKHGKHMESLGINFFRSPDVDWE